MSRRVAREIAFKTLFQYDIGKNETEPTISQLIEENGLEGADVLFARDLVKGTLQNLDKIDGVLMTYLQKWELNRLAAADRNVLRLAAYELMYREDIPAAVSINEALDLSKAYHDEEAAKFLNGVLDKLAQDRQGDEVK